MPKRRRRATRAVSCDAAPAPAVLKAIPVRRVRRAEAADDLALLLEADAEAAKEKEAAQRKANPPGLPLMPESAFDRQAEHEGRIILGELQRFRGTGAAWHGSIPLFDRVDRGGRR